jgi:hypothetical protein
MSVRRRVGMMCSRSSTTMSERWLLPEDSVDCASSVGFQRGPTLHQNLEADVWKLILLACTCGDL